ncbi:unnamed protein product, partial [Phaeothamnion confervicola]
LDLKIPGSPSRFLALLHDIAFQSAVHDDGKDLDVRLTPWALGEGEEEVVLEVASFTPASVPVAAFRTLVFRHPVRTKFPGLPSHAVTEKKQEYRVHDSSCSSITLLEHTSVSNIPYGDYFTVHTVSG